MIFGIIALRQIRASGQRGRGLAIAGLALSAGWVLVIAAGVAFFALTGANRSPVTGLITQQGRLSVYSLLTGDCFDNSAGVKYVATVTAFPCTQPHNAQVYALFRLTGSDSQYPGRAAVVRLAVRGCTARVGSLDRAKVTSAMTVRYLYPQPLLWLDGRRAVTCMIVNPTPTLTSSVLKPAGPLG